MRFKVAIAAVALALTCAAHGADEARIKEGVQFYGPDPNANAVRQYETAFVRSFVEARHRTFVVTDGYAVRSPAHVDGAIDFSSNTISGNERHAEAQAISQNLGSRFSVIVEEGYRAFPNGNGPSVVITPFRSLTVYTNGQVAAVRFGGFAETHTHVQRTRGTTSAQVAAALGLTPTAGSDAALSRVLNEPPPAAAQPGSMNPPLTADQIAIAIFRGLLGGGGTPPSSSGPALGLPLSFGGGSNPFSNAAPPGPTFDPGPLNLPSTPPDVAPPTLPGPTISGVPNLP